MKKTMRRLVIFMTMMMVFVGMLYGVKINSSASSSAIIKNIWRSLFNEYTTIKTTIPYGGSNDTAEGMAVVNDVIYSAKIHTDGTTTLIKTVKKNGKTKNIMPAKNLNLGHANDITYYNGYLYVAGLSNKFYRVKDEGLNSNGFEKYSVKTYTCPDIPYSAKITKFSTATINITHYVGKYFIFCSSINENRYMTFRVGYFNDSTNKFITTNVFTARARAFLTLQSITYKDGYLYQTTSDNSGTGYMNKISEIYIGTKYNKLKPSYNLTHYGTFDNYDVEKFEIEGIDFDKEGKLYILVNIKGRTDNIYVSKSKIVM